jgi:hypothetical protein
MQTVAEFGPRFGIRATCAAVGLARATYYRRCRPARTPSRRTPPRALRPEERQQVLDVLHEERFVDKAPAQVYATLLDEGTYLCSIRSMYRILADKPASPRAAQPAAASDLRRSRTARDASEPAVELGHHQASRSGQVDTTTST